MIERKKEGENRKEVKSHEKIFKRICMDIDANIYGLIVCLSIEELIIVNKAYNQNTGSLLNTSHNFKLF